MFIIFAIERYIIAHIRKNIVLYGDYFIKRLTFEFSF